MKTLTTTNNIAAILTLHQHWPNVVRPTFTTTNSRNICQRWANIGPT